MPMRGRERLKAATIALASREVERMVGKALFEAGDILKGEAQLSLTRGAVSGKNHVPSLPGEPPNEDTGVLGGNIENVQKSALVVEVSSNAEYSAPLEFGTSRMAARPFMRPARDKTRKEIRKLVARAVDRATKTAVR